MAFTYNLSSEKGEYSLVLDDKQFELFRGRCNRKFYKYCSLDRIKEKINSAKTAADLENIIESNDLSDSCDLSGFDIELSKSILNCVVEVMYKYPYIRSVCNYIGTNKGYREKILNLMSGDKNVLIDFKLQYILDIKSAKRVCNLFPEIDDNYLENNKNLLAYYATRFYLFDGILFSYNEMFDYESYIENLKYQVEIGFSQREAGDPKSVCYHELGHALDYSYNITSNEAFKEYYNSLSKDEIIKGVSEYASTSILEFFAECFSEYNLTKMPRKIATNVYYLVDFIMKTRSEKWK